ncbi:helix-turn-helix transcriptional regulator [Halobiforma nitratireducens]|uniref:Membrane protein n=1 Tax=Halobiforma nitratireducens JCM 10879 TaxID=1227454 RepID=M0M156_9EURY|nr:helix-turn-helix domain-containing protein [Halobiforma nitratireducens]EMA39522.1 membrane protein [Halobiforma nitratireducens JCM 10879]
MHRSDSAGVLAVAVLVLLVGFGTPAMAISPSGSAAAGVPAEPVVDTTDPSFAATTGSVPASTAGFGGQANVDSRNFDTTEFEITVHENGSAVWTFRYEQRFDGDDAAEQRERFEAFVEEFESDDQEVPLYERFTNQAEAMAEGTEATDREMEATDFNRSAEIEDRLNPVGVVEMSFTWNGFADTDGTAGAEDNGDRVVVGDVFDGIYLAEDQSIVIEPGDGLEFRSAEPEPRYVGQNIESATSVSWTGEREFIDGHPRVVLVPERNGDGTGTGSDTDASPLSSVTGGDTSWVVPIVVVVALLLAVGAGIAWYRRHSGDGSFADAETDSESHGATARDGHRPESDSTAGSAQPDRPGESGMADESVTEADAVPEEELLTDEDRVVKLIRENGGRMKQVNIVEETGWSKSKVSMLLSDMEEEGTISKLRVGRENIISLEGFEPEATKSPFEE